MNGIKWSQKGAIRRKAILVAPLIIIFVIEAWIISFAAGESKTISAKSQNSSLNDKMQPEIWQSDNFESIGDRFQYLPIIRSNFRSLTGDIAFVSNRDGNNEIYLVNEDGTNLYNLTRNPASDQEPAWSPDGTKLAYVSDRSGIWSMYVLNMDGGVVSQVTNVSTGSRGPVWSPDGNKIAFYSQIGIVDELRINWINADGSGLTSVATLPGYGGRISWSHDGNQLLFDANPDDFDIYIVNLDGSGLRTLARTSSWEFEPALSPDGRYLAFSSDRYFGYLDVYLANADGSNAMNLTLDISYSYGPEWSPDSQMIAFMSTWGLHVTRPNWARPRKLTELSQLGADSQWSWAPGSDRIAFTAGEGVKKEVYIININGSGLMNLSNNTGWDRDPDWRP